MSVKTLFLAWQAKQNQGWYPIGQLDVDVDSADYRFRYIQGAKQAQEEVGFIPLMEFPDLSGKYHSHELFPTFTNRIMSRSRPDFAKYMHSLDLNETMNPIESLYVNGGYRATDAYEVFPKIEKHEDGSFTCRFLLHGSRHLDSEAQSVIDTLTPGEKLYVQVERDNPASGLAVKIHTTDSQHIGWTPRYLADDLVAAIDETNDYSAHVVRVNLPPAPSSRRVLIELNGRWGRHEPMSGDDFKPIVF
ncbi:MAG: HIRAN domain-containing protein [Chloroflexota bacterium]|nr:HIRAN domain-containing protein [Chloroflexota bacterium]